jgi:IS30 family transposase
MSHSRLTTEKRFELKTLLDSDVSKDEVARKLKKHRSTIYREVKRNSGKRGYRPKQAQRLCNERQEFRKRPRRLTPDIIKTVEEHLEMKWSPEQISNRLKLEEKPRVSAETIYKYIGKDRKEGGVLWKNLRCSRRQRKRRFPSEERRGRIKNATPISERPKKLEKRKKLGHWERDTMIGLNRKTCILALVDRKSRFNKFIKLNRRLSSGVTNKTVKALSGLPCKSITNDRGLEFADHERLSQKLKIKVYFCDPYSSYQRGTNENRIGILRQYFPKKTELKNLHWKQLRKVEIEINNRPMKCLDWKTPYEVMIKKSRTD